MAYELSVDTLSLFHIARRRLYMSDQQVSTPKQGAVIGGWIRLALGVALMFLSLFSFIFYLPLFFTAFVLGIVAIASGVSVTGFRSFCYRLQFLFSSVLVSGLIARNRLWMKLRPALQHLPQPQEQKQIRKDKPSLNHKAKRRNKNIWRRMLSFTTFKPVTWRASLMTGFLASHSR